METHFKPWMGQGAWIVHPSVIQEIAQFETTAGGGVFQANFQVGVGASLLGYPIIKSEFMPPQGGDRVALVDLSAYYRFLAGATGITMAYSQHAYFTTGRVAWRFDLRCDGKPWMRAPVIASDGAGTYQMSPFVYLND
jgi:HK97 family phage major capsid protein